MRRETTCNTSRYFIVVVARAEASSRVYIPLRDTHLALDIEPLVEDAGKDTVVRWSETLTSGVNAKARIRCSDVRGPGEVVDSTVCLSKEKRGAKAYW